MAHTVKVLDHVIFTTYILKTVSWSFVYRKFFCLTKKEIYDKNARISAVLRMCQNRNGMRVIIILFFKYKFKLAFTCFNSQTSLNIGYIYTKTHFTQIFEIGIIKKLVLLSYGIIISI